MNGDNFMFTFEVLLALNVRIMNVCVWRACECVCVGMRAHET